jgi:hypothetical protein
MVVTHLLIICCNMFWTHEENTKNIDGEVLLSNLHTLLVTKSTSLVNSKNSLNK